MQKNKVLTPVMENAGEQSQNENAMSLSKGRSRSRSSTWSSRPLVFHADYMNLAEHGPPTIFARVISYYDVVDLENDDIRNVVADVGFAPSFSGENTEEVARPEPVPQPLTREKVLATTFVRSPPATLPRPPVESIHGGDSDSDESDAIIQETPSVRLWVPREKVARSFRERLLLDLLRRTPYVPPLPPPPPLHQPKLEPQEAKSVLERLLDACVHSPTPNGMPNSWLPTLHLVPRVFHSDILNEYNTGIREGPEKEGQYVRVSPRHSSGAKRKHSKPKRTTKRRGGRSQKAIGRHEPTSKRGILGGPRKEGVSFVGKESRFKKGLNKAATGHSQRIGSETAPTAPPVRQQSSKVGKFTERKSTAKTGENGNRPDASTLARKKRK